MSLEDLIMAIMELELELDRPVVMRVGGGLLVEVSKIEVLDRPGGSVAVLS